MSINTQCIVMACYMMHSYAKNNGKDRIICSLYHTVNKANEAKVHAVREHAHTHKIFCAIDIESIENKSTE